jgi:adenylate kinase
VQRGDEEPIPGRPLHVALTGTPGTGKTAVSRLLSARWTVREVAELARDLGAGRRKGRVVRVDLEKLRRALDREPDRRPNVLVGHLAHLLPVDGVVVLRCHPVELDRRLTRGRRGSRATRQSNFVVEAVDLVLDEALRRRVPVWEVDTSDRAPRAVARTVERILQGLVPPSRAHVDWLSDPRVTAHLLRPRP